MHARSEEYDAIVSWGERISIGLMGLDALSGPSKPHIAMLSRFSTPNVRIPLQLFGKHLHAAITWGLVTCGVAWGLANFGFLLWLPTNLGRMGMDTRAVNALLTPSSKV